MPIFIYDEVTKQVQEVQESRIGDGLDIKNQTLKLILDVVGYTSFYGGLSFIGSHINGFIKELNSSGKLTKDDALNIRTIIEEGCKQNVDELEIEMNRKTALGINLDGIDGVDITIGNKGETQYTIKVKYKDA